MKNTHTQSSYVTQTSFEFYELTWHNGLMYTYDQMQDFCGSKCFLYNGIYSWLESMICCKVCNFILKTIYFTFVEM